LTSLAMFAGNVWILIRAWLYREPMYPQQRIAQLGEIPVNGVKLFRYPGPADPCILVRTGPETYVAYSQKCTHLSCAVYYSEGQNRLECPCHEGYFSVQNGEVLQGPPTRPLPRIRLERRGRELFAVAVNLKPEA
jgi:Rieske Fe-S protein